MNSGKIFDLLIIGGGINGVGIARDAAGRGYSVALCEQNDLGSGTSSASTKLIHGGLRYLEHYHFKMVREALTERENLMHIAPHLISPLQFIIPHQAEHRPRWMIQIGLWLYDHLAKRRTLPASKTLKLNKDTVLGAPLSGFRDSCFSYYDCWVDDARLVVANALDAAEHGALIYPRTQVLQVESESGLWSAHVSDKMTRQNFTLQARCIINATGPWVEQFILEQKSLESKHPLRLVKGSHIVVPKQYEGEHAYVIQHEDKRLIFVIPFENDYTLIGTTEIDVDTLENIDIEQQEIDYLLSTFNQHFESHVDSSDIIWHFSGVRPLLDGNAESSALSRDYFLSVDQVNRAPILSVYGGKITTYRAVSETVVNQVAALFHSKKPDWTKTTPLPGGDFDGHTFEDMLHLINQQYPWLPEPMMLRLLHQYGTRIHNVIGQADSLDDLGKHFGADLYEKELQYLIKHEWAQTSDDVLFRRTKLGLRLTDTEKEAVKSWLNQSLVI